MTEVRLDDDTDAARVEPRARRALRGLRLTDRTVLAVIVAGQMVWLGVLLGRGWYSDADLARLAEANGEPLGWKYVANAAGEHFAPADRVIFWVMNRLTGVNWIATVAIRVVLAGAATLLLAYLLRLLVGRRPWLNAVVLCYAFSPLLLPGIAWLTSGANLVCAQVLVLLVLIAHVRYVRTGSWLAAVSVGLGQMVALGFQDQSILTIPMLVLLSLGFLHGGTFTERLRAALRRWGSWASLIVFVGFFGVLYESGHYNRGSSHYGFGDGLRIVWDEWTHVLGPAFVGGPWRWWSNPTTYVSYADPKGPLVVAGQAAFVVLLVLSIRATGRRAIVAWLMPVTVACGGVALAGFGRFDIVKTFIPPLYRYSFTAAVALAVAVTLAFARTPDEQPDAAAEPDHDAPTATATADAKRGRRVVAVAVPAFLALSVWSALGFDQRFAQNPAGDYVANLIASARAAGPDANVYDSAVSNSVIPYVEPRHYVSDVLRLAGIDVRYGQADPAPLVVRPDGRLGPAIFIRSADVGGLHVPNCGVHIGGKGTWRIPLTRKLGLQDWLVNLQTYQARPADLDVTFRDAAGRTITPAGGSRVRLGHRLDSILIRLPVSAPAAVVVHSSDRATTVCMVHVYVGGPLPAGS